MRRVFLTFPFGVERLFYIVRQQPDGTNGSRKCEIFCGSEVDKKIQSKKFVPNTIADFP